MPGCSLCMGNQAQVREGATIMSASTRNVPNRLSGQEHQGVPGPCRTGGGVLQARPCPDRGRVHGGCGPEQSATPCWPPAFFICGQYTVQQSKAQMRERGIPVSL
jgi:hypothetical protein